MDWDNFWNLQLHNLRKYSSVANNILKQNDWKMFGYIATLWVVLFLVGMLFGHANFLGLNFEIYSFISSFVQRETKNKSSLGGGKYKKCTCLNFSAATEQKKLLKVFTIVWGSVTVWSLRLINYFWWIMCHFLRREIMDLFPFQVFFMLLIYFIIFKVFFIVIFFTFL